MRHTRKRSHEEGSSSSSSSKIAPFKKHHSQHPQPFSNHTIRDDRDNPRPNSHQEFSGKRLNFISYAEVPSLPPKIKLLCEIVAQTPSASVERYLEDTGIRVSQEDVEEVLKLSYRWPGSAVKFFRWASFQLNDNHSLYAWNLVVDLLGKNGLFDAMWDAIKSMRKKLLLTLSTFASVFSSYVIVDRVQEAILSFEVLDQFGVAGDVAALNSLLRVMCKEGRVREAMDYLVVAKEKVRLDMETYGILLEGLEKERDVVRARQVFSDMVVDIGWEPRNVSAYDSFLCTVLKGPDGTREALKFFDTMTDRGCYPGTKFLKFAIDECVRKSDAKCAKTVWDVMVGKNICRPDIGMYKSLISLHCNLKEFSIAEKLLDEMAYNGAFPDSETYEMLFHFLIKHRRIREATPVFKEMVKNEYVPMEQDCVAAVKSYIGGGDPHMAVKVWRCMIDNYASDLEETGNMLVVGLRDLNRVPEAVKCAEEMIERGIKLNSATLSKLKQSLSKMGKTFAYEELLSKWKSY